MTTTHPVNLSDLNHMSDLQQTMRPGTPDNTPIIQPKPDSSSNLHRPAAEFSRYGFTTLDHSFVEAARDRIVITPNERLSRENSRSYDLFQAQRHRDAMRPNAWQSLHAMSVRRFFLEEYERLRDASILAGEDLLPVLSNDQLHILAKRHRPEGAHGDIDAFCEAWQLMHGYDLDINAPHFASPLRTNFRRWYSDVRDAVQGRWKIPEKIPDLLVREEILPRKELLLDHLEQLTAPARRYLNWLSSRQSLLIRNCPDLADLGTKVPLDNPAFDQNNRVRLYATESLEQELAAAAEWSKSILLENPSAKIGIVVPQLTQYRDVCCRVVGTILDSEQGSQSLLFDASGGIPLTQLAIWQHSRSLFDLYFATGSFDQVRMLAGSAFWNPPDLLKILTRWPAPGSRIQLDAQALSIPSIPADATSLLQWCRRFYGLLGQVHNSETQVPGSIQYQAKQQLTEALLDLAGMMTATEQADTVSYSAAITTLEQLLYKRVFAPKKPPAPVQILGLLETPGLSFSHLWVCGADENNLPTPPRLNRYIPLELARRVDVPRATPEQEVLLAQRLVNNWVSNAQQLAFSFTHTFDESPQYVSRFVEALNTQSLPNTLFQNGNLLKLNPQYATSDSVFWETFLDERGPTLEEQEVNGGVSVISNQAACPFKAFATHRLGLREHDRPSDFPRALERGIALHQIMHDLLHQFPDSSSLLRVSSEDIRAPVEHYFTNQHLPGAFLKHEVSRLVTLITRWLEQEAQREPFTAVHLEKSFSLDLEAFSINVRVDRMDEIAGGMLVIDYKTGDVRLPAAGEMVSRQPQLPIYSLLDDNIVGVYFAQLQKDVQRFAGTGELELAIQHARHAKSDKSWLEIQRQWEAEVKTLASDFASGRAQVTPAPGACDYCHLSNVCRIDVDRSS